MSSLIEILESLEKIKTRYVIAKDYERAARVREIIVKIKEKMKKETLTFGEQLVGLTFNPSGNEKVQKAKELCAELADLVNQDYENPYYEGDLEKRIAPGYRDQLKESLFQHTIGEILNTQMNVVKLLTFRK